MLSCTISGSQEDLHGCNQAAAGMSEEQTGSTFTGKSRLLILSRPAYRRNGMGVDRRGKR
jgi:hypothetical protein